MQYVAELSGNHLGNKERALDLIRAAANAGATHIKLQTYQPEQMAIPGYIINDGLWRGRELLTLYRQAMTPREWHEDLFFMANTLGVVLFSSPFHPDDVAFLESLNCPLYKIASCELGNRDLLIEIGRTGKPVIVSTGMATLENIDWVINLLWSCKSVPTTLLKCTASYPAPIGDINLAGLETLRIQYPNLNVGLSDHTCDINAALAATAIGASMIEKHFTLSRQDGGPDASFSAEPSEFAEMVTLCNHVKTLRGNAQLRAVPSEHSTEQLKRSAYYVRALPIGHVLTPEDFIYLRPKLGIEQNDVERLIGKSLCVETCEHQPVSLGDIRV